MDRKSLGISMTVLTALLVLAPLAQADDRDLSRRVQDAWIDGKLEATYTLNSHLNPLDIDTKVVDGVVYLTGSVETSIDRDLAGELAKGIKGVRRVENDLRISSSDSLEAERQARIEQRAKERDAFRQWVDDASTTAAVKSRLLANDNLEGMKINVDTDHDVVTLRGVVGSAEERDLAGMIASNTTDVRKVENQLDITGR